MEKPHFRYPEHIEDDRTKLKWFAQELREFLKYLIDEDKRRVEAEEPSIFIEELKPALLLAWAEIESREYFDNFIKQI